MAVTLFISYAHRDEPWLDALLVHLSALSENGAVELWHDRRMVAGEDIFPNIEAALDRAQIVLLLVSEASLASHECQREMWRALGNRERRGADVVPVILQACDWRAAPLGKLNALPTDGVPIFSTTDPAAACRDAVEGVRRLVEARVRRVHIVRRRRRTFFGALFVLAIVLGVTLLRVALPLVARSPSDIIVPAGVVAIAEFSVIAPDGAAWNAAASGNQRLPNLVFCFRHDEVSEVEVCAPSALGARDGRPSFYAHRTHIAERLSGMTAWSRTFSVDVGDRHPEFVRRVGRGRCRFGVPCELTADDATVVGELLVLPAAETDDAALRDVIDRCIDPQSRLARDWLAFAAAADIAAPDLGRASYRNLMQTFVALTHVEIAPGLIDAALARSPPVFAALSPRDMTRASVFRAAATLNENDDVSPLDRTETKTALTTLRSAVSAVAVTTDEGCR